MKGLIVLALAISVLGCNPRPSVVDTKSPTKKEEAKSEQPKATVPAALVFEGGKGSWIWSEAKSRTPYWRLHICLSETDQVKEGSVQIDLRALGTSYKSRWFDEERNESVSSLNNVIVRYSYTAKFIPYNDTFSYGKAEVQSQSIQTWEHVRGDKMSNHLDFFAPQIDDSVAGAYRILGYDEEDGTEMYMGYYYSKVVLDQRLIEACEKSKEPYVLEILKQQDKK
jgi:hypothetical protein